MSPAQSFTYRSLCRLLLLFFCTLSCLSAHASTLVSQTFATAPAWGGAGWNRGGTFTPTVTSANGTTNWLRLIDKSANARGYVYYNTAFSANQGFVIDFEFASFAGSGADGMVMFLFDGAATTFRPGSDGGSLSYANNCAVRGTTDAGMSKAYIGIAFDEWGNFANQSDRCKNGGVGQLSDSVSIRGAGDWDGTGAVPATAYSYLTSAAAATSIDCTGCTTRPESGTNWRRARITMLQSGSSWAVSVDVQFGTGSAFNRLINTYTLPNPPFTTLKVGFAASSGGSTNYHDIRNILITNPVDTQITKTVSTADVMVGGAVSYTLAVSNTNITAAANVVVTDTLPTGQVAYTHPNYTIVPAGGSCTFATPVLTCALGSMAISTTKTITVNTTGQSQSTATNTASVTQDDIDINPNNNIASVNHNIWSPPALTVVKSANGSSSPSTINPGGTILYTITTTNSGAGPSTTNVLTDTMSPFTALDLTYNSSQVFQLIQGSTTSSLTLGTPVYSSDNGLTWTYTLVSGGGGAPAGFDAAVTNFRIPMTGSMNGGGASYTIRYNTRVE